MRLEPLGDVIGVEDGDFVASVRPRPPIMRIYIQEMVRMLALPQGAAETGRRVELIALRRVCRVKGENGRPGRNCARCFATPIGPTPGPPPPCGMQNVLCRFKWQTSAPMIAGTAEADLRVHVRAVHVNLAAVRVDDFADLADGGSSNTPCVDG